MHTKFSVATITELEQVLQAMQELIFDRGFVTVSDMCVLVNVFVKTNASAERWGWLDMDHIDIVRVRNGYLVKLPRPTLVDKTKPLTRKVYLLSLLLRAIPTPALKAIETKLLDFTPIARRVRE